MEESLPQINERDMPKGRFENVASIRKHCQGASWKIRHLIADRQNYEPERAAGAPVHACRKDTVYVA